MTSVMFQVCRNSGKAILITRGTLNCFSRNSQPCFFIIGHQTSDLLVTTDLANHRLCVCTVVKFVIIAKKISPLIVQIRNTEKIPRNARMLFQNRPKRCIKSWQTFYHVLREMCTLCPSPSFSFTSKDLRREKNID